MSLIGSHGSADVRGHPGVRAYSRHGERAILLAFSVLLIASGVEGQNRAYVSNSAADSLSISDTATNTVTTTLADPCTGDCNGDGIVTVDEIIKAVNIVLGNAPFSSCPALPSECDELGVNCVIA
jgi:hypothetical protein